MKWHRHSLFGNPLSRTRAPVHHRRDSNFPKVLQLFIKPAAVEPDAKSVIEQKSLIARAAALSDQ